MPDKKSFRVFATSRIGDPAENRLRERGYNLEVFQGPEAPPKKLIIEKVKSGIDGLITTLRDPIDAGIFAAQSDDHRVVRHRVWSRSCACIPEAPPAAPRSTQLTL